MEPEQTAQPVSQPAPEVTQPAAALQGDPLQTPDRKKWLTIGGAVLVVILAAGVGVLGYRNYYWENYKNECIAKGGNIGESSPPTCLTSASELPPAPPPVPGEPTAETADWKTYTNMFHKYVVQYPQDWYFSKPTCEDNCALTMSDVDLSSLESVPEPNDQTHIRFSVLVLAQDSDSLRQWRNTTVINEEPITLAGISGIKRTELRNDFFQLAEEVRVENLYIDYKGKTYSLYYFPPNSKLKPILDQILSTFRFLE